MDRRRLTHYLSRIPALLILVLLCAVVYVYIDGWFDITFLVRGDDVTETVPPTVDSDFDTIPPSTDYVTAPADTPSFTDRVTEAPSDTSDTPPETSFPTVDELSALGYKSSYGEWNSASWALAELSVSRLPGYFSSRVEEIFSISYAPPGVGEPYEVVTTPHSVKKPSVMLYMGYIIVEADRSNTLVDIYNSTGKRIGRFDIAVFAPAYCRNRDGEPLFTSVSDGGYYTLNEKRGVFLRSDYDPERDGRGANFDYTPDYGISKLKDRTFTVIERPEPEPEPEPLPDETMPGEGTETEDIVTTETTPAETEPELPPIELSKYVFAITNARGELVGDYIYSSAYDFSDSLAAVTDDEGHLFYIDSSGKVMIETMKIRYDTFIRGRVTDYYMPPISNGAESIGYYFFEHGLVRARILTIDYKRYTEERVVYVIKDKSVMMYKNGDLFNIPVGYEVISYSCGMILLHGSRGYGYMSYTGEWIVDPDLDTAEPFYEGLAAVSRGGKYALVDTNGDYVIPFGEFSYISSASTGLIAAYNGQWHILRKMSK